MCKKLIALVVFFTIASTVQAEEKWELVFTSFLWASGQSGDVATLPGAETAEIDLSFSDIADNLDNALMGVFDARKGAFQVLCIGTNARSHRELDAMRCRPVI